MTSITRFRFVPLLLGLALPLAPSTLVRADDAPPAHHRQPPQAAFDACQQKKSGTPARSPSTSTPSPALCQATQDDKLVCRPDHPPGPPPELKAACADKKAGEACQPPCTSTPSPAPVESRDDDGLVCHHADQPRP